jgi:hypothetical protein
MRTGLHCLAALLVLAASVTVAAAADAPPKGGKAVLEMRKDNGPYKNAAYSFRKATGNPAVHRNYVDLLLNKCGSVHVQMVNGQENRICDLGKTTLKDAPDAAPADAKWLTERFTPKAGHVYLEEVKQNGQTMTVKFIVDEVTADTVKLTWKTVKPLEGPDDAKRGAAGTKGQCGGPHKGEE